MTSRTSSALPPGPRQPLHEFDTDPFAGTPDVADERDPAADAVGEVPEEPEPHDEFDYSDLVHRNDPQHPARALDSVPAARTLQHDQETLDAALDGDLTATLSYAADALAQAATDTRTAQTLLGVLHGFVVRCRKKGRSTWHDIPTNDVTDFIGLRTGNTHPSADTRRLRKNAVHAGWLAHRIAVPDLPKVTSGIDPVQAETRQDKRGQGTGPDRTRRPPVQTRPATHDEVTLLRLAAPLSANRKTATAPAAALAVLTSGASVREACQLTVKTVLGTGVTLRAHQAAPYLTVEQVARVLDLPGTGKADGRSIGSPRPRSSRPLDTWEHQALIDLLHEMGLKGRTLPEDYLLYGERGDFNADSAAATVNQHVTKLRTIADLSREAGLTPNSFRMWGVIRDVTSHREAVQAARHFGTSGLTLLRLVRQQGDRNWD